MEKSKYIVHSDVDENNIYKEFDNRDEAIQYAKDHIDAETWVDLVVEDESGLSDEPDYMTIWTYRDEGAYDLDFPKSDLEDLPDDWIEDTVPADWDDVNRFSKKEELNIKEAVNKLEENESEVECKCCFDLFPKEACIKTEDGYVCQKCNQELHSHQGTNLDLIDANPFDLSYEDPRDPEEVSEVEIKDIPTNATEIRKHEKAIEEKLEEGFLDNHLIAETIKDYKVIRWKYDKTSSPKGYKIDTVASKPVYGDLKTAEKYANAWVGVQDEQPNYRRAGIFAVKPGVEEARLNAIQNTDFASVKDSWKNPLDLPQNYGYPELMRLYVLTYNGAKHKTEIYPNSDNRENVANILRNMKNTKDLTDEKSGEEKGAKVVKPENATIDAAAKDLGSGNKFKLEIFDGSKYSDLGMPKAKFEDIEDFMKNNPIAGNNAFKVKAVNAAKGGDEVTIAAFNKRNPDKNNNARLKAFVEGKVDALKENLEEHINEEHPAIESEQVLHGTDNAVVDCEVAKVIAHSEDEKPLDCKMEKPALEEPLAGEEVDIKLTEEIVKQVEEDMATLDEAKKDDELPVDPEAAKLEVHTMLNNLVADEIEAVNGYEEAKAEILDAPIAHKDTILDTIDHVEDEEKEHIDELIDATTEIPFDKEHEAPVVEEPQPEVIPEEPIVEENYEDPFFYVDFPKNEEKALVEVAAPTPFDSDIKVGDTIKIVHLEGENSDYDGKEGTVEKIDDIGQLHGTWGGLAIIPGVDDFEVITNESLNEELSDDQYAKVEEWLKDPEAKLRWIELDWETDIDYYGVTVEYDKAKAAYKAYIGIYHASEDNNAENVDGHTDEIEYTYDSLKELYNDLVEELGEEFGKYFEAEVNNKKLLEASSAETKAFKQGGEALNDLIKGKAIAMIKDPKARAAAIAAVKAGRDDLIKSFIGDRHEDAAIVNFEKKATAMSNAGVTDESLEETK